MDSNHFKQILMKSNQKFYICMDFRLSLLSDLKFLQLKINNMDMRGLFFYEDVETFHATHKTVQLFLEKF